jgi:hypothetical protein
MAAALSAVDAAAFWPALYPAAVAVPPPPARTVVGLDLETYRNYFLAKFSDVATRQVIAELEMFPGQPFDIAAAVRLLQLHTVVTFNGNHYDMPILSAALLGYDNASLKLMSDAIIVGNMKAWDFEREYQISVPAYVDHIDLFEVLPGQASLKMYGGKMHSRRIQDLPIDPAADIQPEQRPLMRSYCGNDLETTIDAYKMFAEVIELRKALGARYGLDLRSKSDAQVAEAVIKKRLGFKVNKPTVPAGATFQYAPPAYLAYQTETLRALYETVCAAVFTIDWNGTVAMPPALDSAAIRIGTSTYRLGIGGLHSSETSTYHIADEHNELSDHDVASYYPRIILSQRLFPPQMGEAFLQIFGDFTAERLDAKRAGRKKEADMVKICINGTFGKTGSPYSVLYAPRMLIQTTMSGQLSLLMLIEMLELCGIPVVSANTDGIVIKCPRSLTWLRDDVIKKWEQATGFETECARYRALFSRDVNNYIAFKEGGGVKLKGAFAPPVPVGPSWPNPTGEICVDAMLAYLEHGTPLEQTVRACRDVRKFVHIRTVKGGGQFMHRPDIEAASTKGGMRAQLAAAGWIETSKEVFWHGEFGGASYALKDAAKLAVKQLREAAAVPREYLGKVVRWYYATGSTGLITYVGSGNKVPRSEGCRPMMELPAGDQVPPDVDIAWYVAEAQSMLADVGVK